MTTALAIFVKTPGYSPIKTRLAATIGRAAAEQFHRLAATAVAAVAQAAMPTVQPCWALAERDADACPLWQGLPRLWQGEGDLGMRLHHVCAELQQRHERVLLIGADAPQISVPLLTMAAQALRKDDTPFVMGRAADGGFWLFGTRQPMMLSTWQSPRYSTAHAADDLRQALPAGMAVARLPLLHDVDVAHDLSMLVEALSALDEPLPQQDELRNWLLTQSLCPPPSMQHA